MVDRLRVNQRVSCISIESMQAEWKEIDGKTVKACLNCGKAVPPQNYKYCSQQCSYDFWAKHNQAGLRKYVYEREQGRCQKCGYTVPVFRARPVRPEFKTPRPEEKDFPHYRKSLADRITHFENLLVIAPYSVLCSCGGIIYAGSDCYCNFPKESVCHRGCKNSEHRLWRKCATTVCQLDLHCVDCGLKAIAVIEKKWKSDHRKALLAFKKAYQAWNDEYTAWVKSGVLQAFNEEIERYEAEYRSWPATVEFRGFVADHVVPIALGGAEFDLCNIQLLCEVCDKEKTKRDMARIANMRRYGENFKVFWKNILTGLLLPLSAGVPPKISKDSPVYFAEFWRSLKQKSLLLFF